MQIASDGGYVLIEMDLEPADDYDADHESIVNQTHGYYPLLRKVYNLEVEDNRTYFVGEAGVWVHNTSGETLVEFKNEGLRVRSGNRTRSQR